MNYCINSTYEFWIFYTLIIWVYLGSPSIRSRTKSNRIHGLEWICEKLMSLMVSRETNYNALSGSRRTPGSATSHTQRRCRVLFLTWMAPDRRAPPIQSQNTAPAAPASVIIQGRRGRSLESSAQWCETHF